MSSIFSKNWNILAGGLRISVSWDVDFYTVLSDSAGLGVKRSSVPRPLWARVHCWHFMGLCYHWAQLHTGRFAARFSDHVTSKKKISALDRVPRSTSGRNYYFLKGSQSRQIKNTAVKKTRCEKNLGHQLFRAHLNIHWKARCTFSSGYIYATWAEGLCWKAPLLSTDNKNTLLLNKAAFFACQSRKFFYHFFFTISKTIMLLFLT